MTAGFCSDTKCVPGVSAPGAISPVIIATTSVQVQCDYMSPSRYASSLTVPFECDSHIRRVEQRAPSNLQVGNATVGLQTSECPETQSVFWKKDFETAFCADVSDF